MNFIWFGVMLELLQNINQSDICASVFAVEPPTNVTFHCHNFQNILEWSYGHLQPDLRFQVTVNSMNRSNTSRCINVLVTCYSICTLNWTNTQHAVMLFVLVSTLSVGGKNPHFCPLFFSSRNPDRITHS